MTRWRIVDEQGGRTHVSTVVLAEDEIDEQLAAEAFIHSCAGWAVTPGRRLLVCRKFLGPNAGVVRTIRAVEFDAMHDHPGSYPG